MRNLLLKIYRDDVRLALVIFVLALAPRAGLVLHFSGSDPVFSDLYYQLMAENYAEGHGLGMPAVYEGAGRIYLRAFRPPLFPFLWGVVWKWTGKGWYTPIRLAHAVLSALTCVLVFFVGQRLLDRPSGLVGAILCSVFPSQIWHGVNLMTEPLFFFFLTLLVLLLLRLKDRPSAPVGLLAGASAALGVLSRSVLIGFVPLAAVWLAVVLPKRRWIALVFLAGFACAMSPWWVRNWQVFHHFVPTTTDGGHGFMIGNNERSRTDPRGVYVPEDWSFIKDVIHDELAINQRFYQRGLAFIKSHPGEWVRLAVDKFCRFWRFYPHADFVQRRYAILYGITYTAVFPFFVAGALLAFFARGAQRGKLALILLLVAYMTAIHMLYIAVIRYREPLMPFLLCYAGYAVTRLLGAGKGPGPAPKEGESAFFA